MGIEGIEDMGRSLGQGIIEATAYSKVLEFGVLL